MLGPIPDLRKPARVPLNQKLNMTNSLERFLTAATMRRDDQLKPGTAATRR